MEIYIEQATTSIYRTQLLWTRNFQNKFAYFASDEIYIVNINLFVNYLTNKNQGTVHVFFEIVF